jgi:hypothetical protein
MTASSKDEDLKKFRVEAVVYAGSEEEASNLMSIACRAGYIDEFDGDVTELEDKEN